MRAQVLCLRLCPLFCFTLSLSSWQGWHNMCDLLSHIVLWHLIPSFVKAVDVSKQSLSELKNLYTRTTRVRKLFTHCSEMSDTVRWNVNSITVLLKGCSVLKELTALDYLSSRAHQHSICSQDLHHQYCISSSLILLILTIELIYCCLHSSRSTILLTYFIPINLVRYRLLCCASICVIVKHFEKHTQLLSCQETLLWVHHCHLCNKYATGYLGLG